MKYWCVYFSVLAFFIQSCATYKAQYIENTKDLEVPSKDIQHTFYFIGDAGNSPIGTQSEALQKFQEELQKANSNSTALFLGDNIYPKGMPKKSSDRREFAEHQLNVQIAAVSGFKGKTIFIPGNHDWYSDGLKGLKRQEDYIEDKLGKNSFLPENGCPIEKIDITDDIVLIIIDTEWYLTNWNKHPNMNDDCDIKTKSKFFDEYESLIKKAQGKTTLIAMHHPLFTNGSHGGQFSFGSHLSPIPILGSLKNIIRKTGGVVTVDIQNKLYNEFRNRIITLSQENDKTIFVSGHDHNLQYIVEDNIPQIISGSGSKVSATRNIGNGQFSYGAPGYSRLDVFKDGSSQVRYYEAKTKSVVFQSQVLPPNDKKVFTTYPASIPNKKTASIYTDDEVNKSRLFRTLWGERYRQYFGTKVTVPTVNLDTLFGGLTPVRKGGGHQSKSLRLKDKKGSEYVMRALRKNAIQYLQAVAFQDQYIKGQFEETVVEDLLLDVFTGSHPYAPFVIGSLSDAVGVFHTNPVLYFVPKQNALGYFNQEFGDELYMIEERADDGHGDKASFGFSNQMISTDDLLKKLKEDEDQVLDEASYIKARLFDMVIGDWDRHEDQWRWATFKESDKTIYRPVPRDRDQAFSVMSDGAILGFITRIVPALRLMESYDPSIKSTKWFNLEPFPLDLALITQSDKTVWDEQVNHIVNNLTDEVIERAFLNVPQEVNDETIQTIKKTLRARRANLQEISDRYYNHINKIAIITGTDKDDWFDIERMPNGITKVTTYRIKKGEKADIIHQRSYSDAQTQEIWIYGLDDKDIFYVFGDGDKYIKLRIIGGQNNDTYNIENDRRLTLYDHRSKKNEFLTTKGHRRLTDNYQTNVYDYKRLTNSSNEIIPSFGTNPDDGFKIGLSDTFTAYGFQRNPFTSRHKINGSYYFATQGFDLNYNGEFANVFGTFNLGLDMNFTSSNFAINFFGFGNETLNPNVEDETIFDQDYNRVKVATLKIAPFAIWRNEQDASIKIALNYESVEVEETEDRFINTFYVENGEDSKKNFLGAETELNFINKDHDAFPTLGLEANLKLGLKSNLNESKEFSYINPSLAIDHKLTSNGQLVLATKLAAHFTFGNGFEFYQAAHLGANNGLRSYRNQRFTGNDAFVQSTDLRLKLSNVNTGIFPLYVGIYGGFDYGRVWYEGEDSDKWNNSIGGGLFLNAANVFVGNLSAFHGLDGLRLAFRIGFGF